MKEEQVTGYMVSVVWTVQLTHKADELLRIVVLGTTPNMDW